MKDFTGKVAVISGGAEGIGLAIARALGEQGMQLAIGDIDSEQLEAAREELERSGVSVLAHPLDVASIDQWRAFTEATLERFGKVHMLVNNAGVGGNPRPHYCCPNYTCWDNCSYLPKRRNYYKTRRRKIFSRLCSCT